MRDDIKKWLPLWEQAKKNSSDFQCPECMSKDISYRFLAAKDRVGNAIFSCNNCKAHYNFCRVIFPENVEYEDMEI